MQPNAQLHVESFRTGTSGGLASDVAGPAGTAAGILMEDEAEELFSSEAAAEEEAKVLGSSGAALRVGTKEEEKPVSLEAAAEEPSLASASPKRRACSAVC